MALFNYIEKNVLNLRPTSVMSDYEVGLRKALQEVYPGLITRGCYFHFTQAIRKRASQIPGFFNSLKSCALQHKLYHKFLRIPLLPASEIVKGFELLKTEAEKYEVFEPFISYYSSQWIHKEGPAAISVYRMDHRTNNFVESHNGKLKALIPPSGNFYKFLAGLIKNTQYNQNNLTQVLKGLKALPKHPIGLKKWNEAIDGHQKLLEKGKIGLAEFLDVLAYKKNASQSELGTFQEGNLAVYEEEPESDVEVDVPMLEAELIQTKEENRRLNSEVLCVVCVTNKREVLLLDCAHFVLCNLCCTKMKEEQHLICPVCRNLVSDTKQIFI